MVSFAAGALVLSTLLAVGTYVAARHYLVDQREQLALRQAYADASFVRQGLLTAGAQEGEVIGELSPPAGSDVLVRRDGQYFSSALGSGSTAVPTSVSERAAQGVVSLAWTRTSSGPAVVVGVPLPAVRAEFYEVSTTDQLAETLRTLATVLTFAAVLTTLGGALLGRTAARRLLVPLDTVSVAAADIAVGRLETRLPGTDDPDLAVIVASFNTMVETLQERIERDARFAADISHELRSPLTTLTASVGVLLNRRATSCPSAGSGPSTSSPPSSSGCGSRSRTCSSSAGSTPGSTTASSSRPTCATSCATACSTASQRRMRLRRWAWTSTSTWTGTRARCPCSSTDASCTGPFSTSMATPRPTGEG